MTDLEDMRNKSMEFALTIHELLSDIASNITETRTANLNCRPPPLIRPDNLLIDHKTFVDHINLHKESTKPSRAIDLDLSRNTQPIHHRPKLILQLRNPMILIGPMINPAIEPISSRKTRIFNLATPTKDSLRSGRRSTLYFCFVVVLLSLNSHCTMAILYKVLQKGYRLPLTPHASSTISLEIASLLQKQAIELAPPSPGFLSHLFTIPKKDGGRRPVLNLKSLNNFLPIKPFKMETLSTIINLLRPHDYLTSLDLKDAFHHVPIHPSHRHLQYFDFTGKAKPTNTPVFHSASACPLGYSQRSPNLSCSGPAEKVSVSPPAWTTFDHSTIARPLPQAYTYGSRQNDSTRMDYQLQEIQSHTGKDDRTPGDDPQYLGHDSIHTRQKNSSDSASGISPPLSNHRDSQTTSSVHRLRTSYSIGESTSSFSDSPFDISTQQNSLTQLDFLESPLRQDLLWWISQLQHWNGRRMLPHQPTVQIFTDASDSGWGIIINQQQYRG